jgi:hypothetical protein
MVGKLGNGGLIERYFFSLIHHAPEALPEAMGCFPHPNRLPSRKDGDGHPIRPPQFADFYSV